MAEIPKPAEFHYKALEFAAEHPKASAEEVERRFRKQLPTFAGNISFVELADVLGVSDQTIKRYARLRGMPVKRVEEKPALGARHARIFYEELALRIPLKKVYAEIAARWKKVGFDYLRQQMRERKLTRKAFNAPALQLRDAVKVLREHERRHAISAWPEIKRLKNLGMSESALWKHAAKGHIPSEKIGKKVVVEPSKFEFLSTLRPATALAKELDMEKDDADWILKRKEVAPVERHYIGDRAFVTQADYDRVLNALKGWYAERKAGESWPRLKALDGHLGIKYSGWSSHAQRGNIETRKFGRDVRVEPALFNELISLHKLDEVREHFGFKRKEWQKDTLLRSRRVPVKTYLLGNKHFLTDKEFQRVIGRYVPKEEATEQKKKLLNRIGIEPTSHAWKKLMSGYLSTLKANYRIADEEGVNPSVLRWVLTKDSKLFRQASRALRAKQEVFGFREGWNARLKPFIEKWRPLVQDSLPKLTPESRRVAELLYLHGLSMRAAARELGVPLKELKSRREETLAEIKKIVETRRRK